MRIRRTRPKQPLAAPLLLLLLASTSGAVFLNDFSAYPGPSQECLYSSADASGCDGDTVTAMNKCLCGNNGNFVTNTASCLAAKDPKDMSTVYDTMDENCSGSGTPLAVSRADFLAAKPQTTSPGKTGTGTGGASKTSSGSGAGQTHNGDGSSNDDGSGSGGLSTGARNGIIAAAAVVGVALLGVLAFFLVRYRRRRGAAREEAHPMLPQESGAQSRFDGSVASATPSDPYKAGDKWQTTPNTNWESPYETPWGYNATPGQPWGHPPVNPATGYPIDPATGYPVGAHQQPVVHELQSNTVVAPVEMAASTPIHPPGSGQQYSGADWGPEAGRPAPGHSSAG